jgi:acetyl esterase
MITRALFKAYEQVRQHLDTPTTYRLLDLSLHGLTELGRRGASDLCRSHLPVEVLRSIAYKDSELPAHTLDIFIPRRRPKSAPARERLPAVLYLHGGAFVALSKDTHWLLGMLLATQGYLVFNVNYRLAPAHPFPAALEDVCAAFGWVVRHMADYGGDPARLALAGESAGANLATGLTVCACYERPEPYARAAFELGVRPAAVLPACGLLQVSNCERLLALEPCPGWVVGLVEMVRTYLPGPAPTTLAHELADPLVLLEQNGTPQRALPPFFIPVGLCDPLLADSQRLAAALWQKGAPYTARYYPGERHAFHTMLWRRNARLCWREMYAFLRTHL